MGFGKFENEHGVGILVGSKHTVGRPRKRWQDEINEFLKPEETEEMKGNEKNQRHLDKCSKKSRKLESNGNRIRSCSSKLPLTRSRTRYATNARNLTYVLGVNELLDSWRIRRSAVLAVLFYSGRARGYVTLSTDNLVSLNEQQFVDLVS